MRSHAPIIVRSVVLLIAVEWTCGGGAQPSPPLPESTVPTPTLLCTLYRVVVDGTDRMTTVGPNEWNSYPMEAHVYHKTWNWDSHGATAPGLESPS